MQKKVLIVDDDPNLVKSLTFVLSKEGYATDSSADGEEALIKINDFKPDIVFLDIMMPKKNGYEVCQELKANPKTSDIHIVMLTAKGQGIDRAKAMDSKADEFFTKPFSPIMIVGRLRELFS
ncbi:MAG: response regulator [Chloroflexi bacterium]|nr:response regulator [Chloroflexota bacterium]